MTEEMTRRPILIVINSAPVWDAWEEALREQLDRFEFFQVTHAISPEVWAARPYIPYTADDPEPVRKAFQSFAPNQQKWALNTAKKGDGFIMVQHAIPGLGLLDIPPQLRPYEPIFKGTTEHYHPTDPPKDVVPLASNGKPLSERRRSKAWAQRFHIQRHDDHNGVNNEDVHCHEEYAKYLLTIKAEIPHDGPGRPIYDDDPRKSPGKRIDVHPLAWQRLPAAELVYFCIEGKIKADAILTEILRLDLPQSVCSVPSVGQWDAYELDAFARRDLAGKMVAIICDADGGDNPNVMTQALLLRGRLRESALGVRAAAIFAPPYANYKADPDLKGGDDHLGSPGRLDDLEMLGRKVPARPLVEWAMECQQVVVHGKRARWDRVGRDLRTLMGISLLLGPDGQGQPSLRRIARFIGMSDDGVKRALKSLINLGGIETDKPIATARWQWKSNTYRSPDLELVGRPTIRIVNPNLRAIELPTERLSEWIERQTVSAPWEEEPMTLEERVETIEAALAQLGLAIMPRKKSADDQIETAAVQLEAAIEAWNGEHA